MAREELITEKNIRVKLTKIQILIEQTNKYEGSIKNTLVKNALLLINELLTEKNNIATNPQLFPSTTLDLSDKLTNIQPLIDQITRYEGSIKYTLTTNILKQIQEVLNEQDKKIEKIMNKPSLEVPLKAAEGVKAHEDLSQDAIDRKKSVFVLKVLLEERSQTF